MSTVTKEIMNLARKAGYEGEDKTNVTKAIDALADTLAGENLEQATNVAAAIRKLQPYINGGGSGGGDDEVTSYTLENYNTINISAPEDTTLQEDEVEAWIDEQIENWINGQEDVQPKGPTRGIGEDDSEDSFVKIAFNAHGNMLTEFFPFLLDKNKNIINIESNPEVPAVGGGITLDLGGGTVFTAMTLEKESIVISGAPGMFHLSPQQNGYYHLLYAIRTVYDSDVLVPVEVIDKFDAEELIEDTVTITAPAGTVPVSLVNYPSLNSPLSLDDYIAAGFNPNQIAEPRIVLCEIYIQFGDSQ